MRTKLRRLIAAVGTLGLAAGALVGTATAADATKSTTKCASVVTIAVRGTTSNGATSLGILGTLANKVQSSTSYANRIINLNYPSDASAWYGIDVGNGETNLRNTLTTLTSDCSNTRFVLLGYSKGAHVIGDTLDNRGPQLSSTVNGRIKAVVLWGDPTFRVGEAHDRGTYTTNNVNGIFARPTGDLSKYSSRIRSYCDYDDSFCNSGRSVTVHESYAKNYTTAGSDFVIGKLGG